jgi:hypothetical protein
MKLCIGQCGLTWICLGSMQQRLSSSITREQPLPTIQMVELDLGSLTNDQIAEDVNLRCQKCRYVANFMIDAA